MVNFPKNVGLFIVCRLHSKRFPNKIKKKFLGKSILEVLIIRLLKKFPRNNIVICSSNKNKNNFFVNIAKKYKIKLYFGSDKNLFDRYLKCMNKFNFKHFVRITGDNPFTDIEAISKISFKHIKHKNDYTFTKGLIRGTRPEIFSKNVISKFIFLAEDTFSSEYLTFYFHRKIRSKNYVKFKTIFSKQKYLSISIDKQKNFENLKKIILNENDYLLNRINLYKKLKSKIKYFQKKIITRIPIKTKKYNARLKTDPKNLKFISVMMS